MLWAASADQDIPVLLKVAHTQRPRTGLDWLQLAAECPCWAELAEVAKHIWPSHEVPVIEHENLSASQRSPLLWPRQIWPCSLPAYGAANDHCKAALDIVEGPRLQANLPTHPPTEVSVGSKHCSFAGAVRCWDEPTSIAPRQAAKRLIGQCTPMWEGLWGRQCGMRRSFTLLLTWQQQRSQLWQQLPQGRSQLAAANWWTALGRGWLECQHAQNPAQQALLLGFQRPRGRKQRLLGGCTGRASCVESGA